jgi:hypothetical protein
MENPNVDDARGYIPLFFWGKILEHPNVDDNWGFHSDLGNSHMGPKL